MKASLGMIGSLKNEQQKMFAEIQEKDANNLSNTKEIHSNASALLNKSRLEFNDKSAMEE